MRPPPPPAGRRKTAVHRRRPWPRARRAARRRRRRCSPRRSRATLPLLHASMSSSARTTTSVRSSRCTREMGSSVAHGASRHAVGRSCWLRAAIALRRRCRSPASVRPVLRRGRARDRRPGVLRLCEYTRSARRSTLTRTSRPLPKPSATRARAPPRAAERYVIDADRCARSPRARRRIRAASRRNRRRRAARRRAGARRAARRRARRRRAPRCRHARLDLERRGSRSGRAAGAVLEELRRRTPSAPCGSPLEASYHRARLVREPEQRDGRRRRRLVGQLRGDEAHVLAQVAHDLPRARGGEGTAPPARARGARNGRCEMFAEISPSHAPIAAIAAASAAAASAASAATRGGASARPSARPCAGRGVRERAGRPRRARRLARRDDDLGLHHHAAVARRGRVLRVEAQRPPAEFDRVGADDCRAPLRTAAASRRRAGRCHARRDRGRRDDVRSVCTRRPA